MNNVPLALKENGYIVFRKVFSESELDPLRQLIDEVMECEEGGFTDPFAGIYLEHRTDQGVLYDVCQRHPEFRSLAHNNRILDALCKCLAKTFIST